MAERDMTEAGREWMAGEMPAHEYFEMVRRSVRRDVVPGRRLRAGLAWVLRGLGSPYAGREGREGWRP